MKKVSTIVVLCVGGLLTLGMVMLYSASMTQAGAQRLAQQLVWCGLGSVLAARMATLDYRRLERLAWVLLIVGIVLLVLVLVPGIGRRVGGARRWLAWGPVRFQPSEFVKVALVIAIAWYGSRFHRWMPTFTWGVLVPGAVLSVVLGLIFFEPDRGGTVFLAAVSGLLLLMAGVRWRYILPPALVGAAMLGLLLWRDPLVVRRVFDGWFNMEANKEGVAWQGWQSLLAFGAGGWTGVGLGDGRQKLGFLPEQHTDFILPVVGEELGAVATLAVVSAFLVLSLCGFYIAFQARETFGFLLAGGLTLLISLQAIINIGVATSLLPNKGLSLPFISYGGSNLVMMLTSIGLLLSVARSAGTPVQVPVIEEESESEVVPLPMRQCLS